MKAEAIRRRKMTGSEKTFVFLILGTALIHFIVFTLTPLLFSLYLSFTEWPLLKPPKFVGFGNYIELMRDRVFLISLKNTFVFALMYVPPMLVFSLGLALLVNGHGRAGAFFKSTFFLPVVTSFVVFAVIFKWIFMADPASLANQISVSLGLKPQAWLQNPNMALPLVALLGLLKGAAWNMVYFLAGLQSIPNTFYEAARVDGAGRLRVFRSITLPLLRPTLYLVCVLTTIGAFQVFDAAYLLTQGGPNNATTTIVYFTYQAGFESFRMGYASASAYILLLMVLVVTWIQKRWLGAPADWY